jgi:hypothetical protein
LPRQTTAPRIQAVSSCGIDRANAPERIAAEIIGFEAVAMAAAKRFAVQLVIVAAPSGFIRLS